MFLNLLGNIFASWGANFVCATVFPEVGKQGIIDRKHSVPQQCFLVCLHSLLTTDPSAMFNKEIVIRIVTLHFTILEPCVMYLSIMTNKRSAFIYKCNILITTRRLSLFFKNNFIK